MTICSVVVVVVVVVVIVVRVVVVQSDFRTLLLFCVVEGDPVYLSWLTCIRRR